MGHLAKRAYQTVSAIRYWVNDDRLKTVVIDT
jgi:hypothetical protein